MSSKPRILAPNYTPTPNVWLDEIMPLIDTVAELKVTLAILRATFGWAEGTGRKLEDKLSWSQLAKKTKLSRQSVINGLKAGMERGSIGRKKDGKGYKYHLIIDPALVKALDRSRVQTLDPSDEPEGTNFRPSKVSGLDGSSVQSLDGQKKDSKETKKSGLRKSNEAAASGHGREASPPSPEDRIFVPNPFPVDAQMREWATKECPLVNLDDATDKFVIEYDPEGEAGGEAPRYGMKLWLQKWRTWMRREQKFETRDRAREGYPQSPSGKPASHVPDSKKRDFSSCPDCSGTGVYYPEGFDKGVQKCKHANMPRPTVEHVGETQAQV
jgi:hypothetical protein